MAVTRQEVDALADGLDIRQPNTGSFALNTFRETETHQVREGFGLLWESEPSARNPTEGAWGALRLLGCRSITTNFNHVQTVAVYRSRLMSHHIDASLAPRSYGHRYGAMITILPREALDTLGCFDERFKGWGGEDIAFLRALDTLFGKHKTIDDDVMHLWHPVIGLTWHVRFCAQA